MDRTTLRSTIRMKLGESTGVFWTDAMINQWLEDGQSDIVWHAKLKRTRGTFSPSADTARYTISAIFPSYLRAVSGGVWVYNSSDALWHRCDYKSKEYMDKAYPEWPNADASTPFIYMEDTDENVFELYPPPDSNCAGTDYVRVYYSKKPTAMALDTSEPDLPSQLHTALIEYVVSTGYESRGYGDLANDHWSKYYDKIKAYLVGKDNKEDEEIVMYGYRNI